MTVPLRNPDETARNTCPPIRLHSLVAIGNVNIPVRGVTCRRNEGLKWLLTDAILRSLQAEIDGAALCDASDAAGCDTKFRII